MQLKTKTKLFSGVGNDAREAPPNTLISHIDLGMPGALPVLNHAAIELGIRAGLALNSQVQHFSKFDRKHYFYPDLPTGYQITQFYNPIIRDGSVKIVVNGEERHPLYQELIAAQPEALSIDGTFKEKLDRYGFKQADPTDVLWNFEKFLIARDGSVAGRFSPELTPDGPEITAAIEAELAK